MPVKTPLDAWDFGNPKTPSADASSANETTLGSRARFLFGCFSSKIAIICSIGVMPQIASFEKGKLYEIAPTSLPFTYTGEPDIPANTAVRSAPPPLIFPTMKSCFGPIPPGTTPSISTLNSSGSVPRKTVIAVPRMPSFTSERGRNGVEAADLPADAAVAVGI